jgi:choline dehydrogenase-like flavoprotein
MTTTTHTGGSVRITSPNAFAKPTIDPNYVSTDFDMFALVESVKAAKRFVAARAWGGYVVGAFGELAEADTDAQIRAYVRNTGTTIFHAVGTAMMSGRGASYGVVDPDLKVKGVAGLRIVDGSVLVSLEFVLPVERF